MLKDVKAGKYVSAFLSPGVYYMDDVVCAKASWTMEGKNAVIYGTKEVYSRADAVYETAGHYVCKLKKEAMPFCLFADEEDRLVPVSESVDPQSLVNEIVGNISGETAKGSYLTIPIPETMASLDAKAFEYSYGYFDCGWESIRFKTESCENGLLKCISLNIANTGKLNFEKTNYQKSVRLVLYNTGIKAGCVSYDSEHIYIPKTVEKMYVVRPRSMTKADRNIVSSSSFVLKGVTFKDFRGIYVSQKLSDTLTIKSCRFENTIEDALTVIKQPGGIAVPADISSCQFLKCSICRDNLLSLNSEAYTGESKYKLSNCIISRYPSGLSIYKNCDGAVAVKADAEIVGNIVYNTSRDHLYLNKGRVLVKNNILFNGDNFNSYEKRNLSSDFGIIYCNHIYSNTEEAVKNTSNRIEISENYIFGARRYGIMGVGIYIDDGRGDVTCTKNIVLDCQDASIDSRAVNSYIGSSSIRNVIEGNILDTRYRLQSGEQVSATYAPIADDNYILGDFENILDGVNQRDEDNDCNGVKYFVTQSRLIVDKSSSDPELTKEYRNHKYVKFVSAANFDSIVSKSSEK